MSNYGIFLGVLWMFSAYRSYTADYMSPRCLRDIMGCMGVSLYDYDPNPLNAIQDGSFFKASGDLYGVSMCSFEMRQAFSKCTTAPAEIGTCTEDHGNDGWMEALSKLYNLQCELPSEAKEMFNMCMETPILQRLGECDRDEAIFPDMWSPWSARLDCSSLSSKLQCIEESISELCNDALAVAARRFFLINLQVKYKDTLALECSEFNII